MIFLCPLLCMSIIIRFEIIFENNAEVDLNATKQTNLIQIILLRNLIINEIREDNLWN